MGKSTRPLVAEDFFGQVSKVDDMFGKVATKETTRSGISGAKQENLQDTSIFDDQKALDFQTAIHQPFQDVAIRSAKQFGANVVSSIGQGLANTFDLVGLAKTAKGEITGSDDDFSSSLFGLTTKDMQDWANGVAERNQIYERKEGSFDLTDMGWWAKQFASAGTGVGMGLEALATTAAIELTTGGMGTAAAIGKLGQLGKRIMQGARGAEALKDAVSVAKGLRSAATVYGVMSRTSESRMEAMGSYDEIYKELDSQTKPDGTKKYTEEEKKAISSEGARRTFNLNMALLPLDIIGYRTMVFNPISGASTGLLERGFAKIGNNLLRKGVQGAVFTGLEGTEEVFQRVGSEEGKQYAKVLAGMDDGSNLGQRLQKYAGEAETWNNFAGGVIGSPIIGGAMKVVNKLSGNQGRSNLNELHGEFIGNIARMDSAFSGKIKELEGEGKTREASVLRRQFAANKALSALHLDAMADKNSAFDSHLNFLQATLGELNAGKTDALSDLGFQNTTPEQLQVIKQEFESYAKDAKEMQSIYNQVKDKYNKNFVPEVAYDHFQLGKLIEEKNAMPTSIADLQSQLNQFGLLSTQGQQIYNSEYTLKALQEEKARLTNLSANTKDERTKNDISEQIADINSRLTSAKAALETVQTDENYKPELKTTDNAIIGSALRSGEYLQQVYDDIQLDSEIALKRKEIARWNDPTYLEEKTRETIKKAKTPAQVKATKQALDNEGNKSESLQETVSQKESELAAKAAAKTVQEEGQGQKNANEGIGNSDLFADTESNQLIDGLKGVANLFNMPQEEGVTMGTEVEAVLDPAEFDFENSSDEARNKITEGVKGLIAKLPESASFSDLVNYVIKHQGKETGENIFNVLAFGWRANGKAETNFKDVYDAIFNNPFDLINAGIQGLSPKKVIEQTKKIEQEDLPKQDKPEGFDNNSQPIYVYKGFVTNESSPKMAFISRLSELQQQDNEDGSITVTQDYTAQELNTGEYVDSTQLLDPDKWNEGTEAVVKVPTNYLDIKIPIYDALGNKLPTKTFGQYVAEKNLTPEDQEYKDKIPMIIYRKGSPSTEKGVAFVHDTGWYNTPKFNQNIEFKEDRENAIKNTRLVREGVLSNNNEAEIVITGKRQTTFAGLKTPKLNDGTGNYQTIPLRQANPQTKIAVAKSADELNISKRVVGFPNNNKALINDSPFTVGHVYDVRRFGNKDGKETHVALPVIMPKIDNSAKTTVLQALYIYSSQTNKEQEIRSKHDPIVKSIKDTMGLDILSPAGIEEYLKHFIHVFNSQVKTSAGDNLTDVVAQAAKSQLPHGTPYISFQGGQIIFGQAGIAPFANSQYKARFINPRAANPAGNNKNILALKDGELTHNGQNYKGFFSWFQQNVNLDNLSSNKPIVTIDEKLNTVTTSPSYNDYLLDRLHTNIKSVNIGTKEAPNYVTNIQPVITYDLKSSLSNQQVQQTDAEIARVQEQERSEEAPKEANEDKLAELRKQILERSQKFQSNNTASTDDELYDPAEMTDEERKAVTSDINRIAGLTPDQQFVITNFMYNQVVPMIDTNGGSISKAEADAQIDKTFKEVVAPYKKEVVDTLEYNLGLIKQFPELADAQIQKANAELRNTIAKIESIEANLDTLKEEAFNKVKKYTNISEDKVENAEAKLEGTDENDNQVDFWTDILAESPDNKMTYSMRRFFGQIREYDKTGKPMTGFLGLPLYMGADTVSRTLMVTLADVPSNFDVMVAKLEERKAAMPWVAEVIDRLKNADKQRKAQFVSVMSNHSLRMKFTMISYNKRTESWTTKVMDTALTGLAKAVQTKWNNSLIDSELILVDQETGNYTVNLERASFLLQTFEGWRGTNLKQVSNPQLLEDVRKNVGKDSPVKFTPSKEIVQELATNIVKNTDRMVFSLKGMNYQITKLGNGQYQMAFLQQTTATDKEVAEWLSELGITLSAGTMKELKERGLYHNFKQRTWPELFQDGNNTNGLFGILYNKLKKIVDKGGTILEEEGNSPLEDSVVTSLANLEAKYNNTETPFAFRDGGKSIYALTAPKFITDRTRDLKNDEKTRQELSTISFSKGSFWLRLLSDKDFRDRFEVSHIGLTAFKELGKRNYKDNSITSLSDLDHELAKLGMFWDMTQGQISYVEGDNTYSKYPDTSIALRMATMFSPTMSDKSMMTLVKTAILDLQNKDLNDGEVISEELTKVLYNQLVKPELTRMIKHAQIGSTNIKDYDKGAKMFLMLPSLNNLELSSGLKLVDAIKHEPNTFDLNQIENDKDIMDAINKEIVSYVNTLTEQKVAAWEKNGLVVADKIKFGDKKYLDKFRGETKQITKMAAMDFVVNNLISNANSFMMFAGDPALYFKSKSKDALQQAKDTFVNVGKRLAAQIAPGQPLANSDGEKYIQLFLKDRESVANNIEYLERLLGKEEADSYRKIEGADAQEYTTWQEHLHILSQMGKLSDVAMDITPDEIEAARELFSKDKDKSRLTAKERELIGKVLQPIKPVYTGQIYDKEQDVMRTVYIKSSSFPLIPQLTAGMEIDKLRVMMEEMQTREKMNVRASYQTANKVGADNNPMAIWNDDGTINQEELDSEENTGHMVLDRKNFRIQQEVPFKSGKNKEDKITLGTQIMKLLFGDEILNLDGFMYNGKPRTGRELHRIYNDTFIDLIKEKRNQLFDELGLAPNGQPINIDKSMVKLQYILKNEAVNRGYPLQDIQGLELKDGQFVMPLWSSANSNRYESMLNAIVANRLIKMKFPGNSYVVGSEEGFKVEEWGTQSLSEEEIEKQLLEEEWTSGDYSYSTYVGEDVPNTNDGWTKPIKITKNNLKDALAAVKAEPDAILDTRTKTITSLPTLKIFQVPITEGGGARVEFQGLKDLKSGLTDMSFDEEERGYIKKYYDNLMSKYSKSESNIDQSKIIFTSSWNGKELLGSRTDDGKLQKAQVLVASKFRDGDGNIVDLFQKENGEYKYITKTDSGFRLKEDMFDKDLLSLTSFRIPTSGHQSASQIEIVGFLPHTSADLMIVPKGFTKQKGLDFDIDKENTYQLHHYYTTDGRFEVLSEKHRDEYLFAYDKVFREDDVKNLLQKYKSPDLGTNEKAKIKKEIESKLANNKLFNSMFPDGFNYSDEDIAEEKFLTKLNSKLKEKFLQNEIIKIHSAILSNPSDEMQKKIVKTLNTDFAEEQADMIEKLGTGAADAYWTPLSDEYQKSKMGLGAAGKIGTGAYSLDVVFHSLTQQANLQEKAILLTLAPVEGEQQKTVNWRFGKVQSDGTLGRAKTLDGARTISEVMAERQNVAVDNEKLQIMGRVGLNDLTLDVDKVFNLLGFDKGEDGNSISFLFLSQPIIKEFVEKMKNLSSNVSEFMADKEQVVFDELLKKYEGENTDSIDEAYWSTMSDRMTNNNLIEGIKSNGADGKLQGAVLRRFLEMKKYGIAIRGIQTSINVDSKGLGKSFFEVIEKRNALNRLGVDTDLVKGASVLIGDYVPKAEGEQGEDFIDIGEYYVKPTTLSGAFAIHGVSTAYNLWSKHFPYDAGVTQQAFKEVMQIIGKDDMGASKSIELKQAIFQGIKKYAGAQKNAGIIKSTDDINAERLRIFIDTDENTSLAKYLKGLMETTDNNAVNTFIKTNKLLNRFEFQINKNGQPSLIKFNNAAGEEFDEQYLYESLSTLMEIRGKSGRVELPQIGNKKYTLDSLAQDLIAYCYLGNVVQEAVQFTKYVPISYLNTTGYSARMRQMAMGLRDNSSELGLFMNTEETKHNVGEFVMQFIQHNPERVKAKRDADWLKNDTIKFGEGFLPKDPNERPTFISVYDNTIPKGEKKFRLYWFDGNKYTQVPVLGQFGMDEYQPGNRVGRSIVNGKARITAKPEAIIIGRNPDEDNFETLFNVGETNAKGLMTNITNSNATPYTELARRLAPLIPDTLGVEINSTMTPKGKYLTEEKKIWVSNRITNDANQLSNTIIHEVVHALTYDKINQYITVDAGGDIQVKNDAPIYVSNLVRMYNRLRANVDQAKLKEVIATARNLGMLSPDDKNQYYGYTSIHEFMTMALTNKEFQEALNKIPYDAQGTSFLDKFKQFVADILKAVGVNFDPNFTAAHAISNIFEFIENENKPSQEAEFNEFDHYYDDSINPPEFWTPDNEGTPEEVLNPSNFPDKIFNIQEENCL